MLRDNIGVSREWNGFSVVAPIRMMCSSSMSDSSAACCTEVILCISSMNMIVGCFSFFAWFPAFRMSFIFNDDAFSFMTFFLVVFVIISAMVVFPVPAGPYKMIDFSWSSSIAFLNGFPWPRMCSWPTSWFRFVGLKVMASAMCLPCSLNTWRIGFR